MHRNSKDFTARISLPKTLNLSNRGTDEENKGEIVKKKEVVRKP